MDKEQLTYRTSLSLRDRIKRKAHARLKRAVERGELPPASDLICTDCGAQAEDYDHRDLRYALKVVPVCHGCNMRRGPAFPPITEEDELAYKHPLASAKRGYSGKSWSSMEGGEGFSPLEAILRADSEMERTISAFNLRNDSGGAQGSDLDIFGNIGWSVRLNYFKKHDPWGDSE